MLEDPALKTAGEFLGPTQAESFGLTLKTAAEESLGLTPIPAEEFQTLGKIKEFSGQIPRTAGKCSDLTQETAENCSNQTPKTAAGPQDPILGTAEDY